MPEYTVRDKKTGKTITFAWSGGGEPGEDDLEEVFKAARSAPPTPKTTAPPEPYDLATGDAPRGKGVTLADVKDFGIKALPAVGATAAALGGPPGWLSGIAAAGLGGMAGSFLKQGADVLGDAPVSSTPQGVVGTAAREGLDQAAYEGGGRALGGLAAKLAPPLAHAAVTGYSKALGSSKGTAGLYEKAVPGMIERGIKGTAGGIARKTEKELTKAWDALEAGLDALPPGTQVDSTPVLATLEKAKEAFADTPGVVLSKAKIAEMLKAEEPLPDLIAHIPGKKAEFAVRKVEEFQKAIAELGPQPTFNTLRRTRQVWDKFVSQAGGFHGKPLKEGTELSVMKEAADSIRATLGEAHPTIDALNKEYSFWKRVGDILEAKSAKDFSQAGGGLGYGGYVLAGEIGRGEAVRGIKEVALLHALRSLVDSPAWGTTSGIFKDRLAKLLAEGNEKGALALIGGTIRATAPPIVGGPPEP